MKHDAHKKIFLSYRVQDTAGETGRLVDALKQHFTDEQIFMDIDNLEPGADFTKVIEKSLDTCDVFLAVIGPRWAGESSDGRNLRISDPNDWVRMEVSTALQRNIRVVPVLVDGGMLPTAEKLPPDLQPLLRRQAIEISNKRWWYDVNQLIQFLINTAGIEPGKNVLQKDSTLADKPVKSKSWMYAGAGLVLAVALFFVLRSLLSSEKQVGDANDKNEQTTNQQTVSPADSVNKDDKLQDYSTTGNEANKGSADITGTWEEMDEGQTSTFILKQNGKRIDLQVKSMGATISGGEGEVNNKNVELHFQLFGSPTVLKATLSDDGNSMKGTYTMQASGEAQSIQLVRKSK